MNGLHYAKNLNQLSEQEIESLAAREIKILANHSKYEEHQAYGIKMDLPFYYTILRDPVERFISHYNFFYFKEGMDGCKDITLNDLPSSKLIELTNQLANIQINFLTNLKHANIIGKENVFKIAVYNLKFDFASFGILEYMDESIHLLQQESPNWLIFENDFPALNTHKKEISVSKEVLSIIQKSNEWDIKLYEYALKIFRQKIDTNESS